MRSIGTHCPTGAMTCSQIIYTETKQAYWLISAEKGASKAVAEKCEDLLAQCYKAVETVTECTMPLTADERGSEVAKESHTNRKRSTSVKTIRSTTLYQDEARLQYFEQVRYTK